MSESTANNPAIDTLLHATDLHFWEVVRNPLRLLNKRFLGNLNVWLHRRHVYRTELAPVFAEAIAATGVRALLLGGDFTSTATDREFAQARDFAEALRDRGLRIIAIPGNHDVYTFEALREHRFECYFQAFLPPQPLPCRIALPNGTPLVLAPTVCPNVLSSRGKIDTVEIAHAAELVRTAPAGPVLVAAHYPLLRETSAYRTSQGRILRNADIFRAGLAQTGRQILYLSGHVHRFSHVRDPLHPQIVHVTTGALFYRPRNGHARGGFTELSVLQGGFEAYAHRYDGTWTREALPAR